MTRQQALLVALFLAFLHLVLANLYASETPYRAPGVIVNQRHVPAIDIGAPDERQHVSYVARMARREPFPVLDPKDPNLGENYESHQPPLYYLIAGTWARMGGVSTQDLSSEGEGIWVRRLNTVFGAASALGAFFLGMWGFKREDIALGAATIVALLPMNVALSGAISNDPLLIALCTWTMAVAAKAVADGWNWKLSLGVGLLMGAAFLTKTTAVALLPVLLIAAAIRQPKRPTPAMIASTIAILALMVGPWLLRNQRLYGDPIAMSAFRNAFPGSPHASDIIAAVGPGFYWTQMVGWWAARSFFGVFGYMDIFWPSALYLVLILAFVVLALGWVFSSRRGEQAGHSSVQWLNTAFVVLVLALFLQFNNTYFQAQARYVFPALGSIAVMLSIGLRYLAKDHWRIGLGALAVVLLGLNVYTLVTLPDAFALRRSPVVGMRWPKEKSHQLEPELRYSAITSS